jgi:hypothetical protein
MNRSCQQHNVRSALIALAEKRPSEIAALSQVRVHQITSRRRGEHPDLESQTDQDSDISHVVVPYSETATLEGLKVELFRTSNPINK